MTAELRSASHGHTMVLTIHNPAQRIALGPAIYAAGVEALEVAERKQDVRSVVITGAQGHFSAGADLRRLRALRREDPDTQAQDVDALHGWIESIRTFPKPVIAAVEGAAAGAGFSLALACDFLVAASNAVFRMAHNSVALSPAGGGSWALARSLPRQQANQLLMLGETMDAAALHAAGLATRITAPGRALAEALELADALHARAPHVLASIKELLNDAGVQPLGAHLAAERGHFVRNLGHAAAGEGIAAFLEGRRGATPH